MKSGMPLVLLLAFGGIAENLGADVSLPALFSDHAVLQRAEKVPIWGYADPGEEITITIAGEKAMARADVHGAWQVRLNLAGKSSGPFVLEAAGKNRLTVSDVLIGEVWICSGQSNMDWKLDWTAGAKEEVAASADLRFRVFSATKRTSVVPLDRIGGQWMISGPKTSGEFTAVGYYFGKNLRKAIGTPVGLINVAWGGTPVEAWISREALETDSDLDAGSKRAIAATQAVPAGERGYLEKLAAWEERYHRNGPAPADVATFANPEVSTADWTGVELPARFSQFGLPDAGAIWIRREVSVTPGMTVGPIFIEPGILHDFDTMYVNGAKVGETSPESGGSASSRFYYAAGDIEREGKVTLAIRIVAPAGGAGVDDPGTGLPPADVIVPGRWLAKVEYALPPLAAEARGEYPAPRPNPPAESKTATFLFNGTVNPLIPFAIRGVVWYQGEDNADRGFQYRKSFSLMILDWRRRWGQGDFPFYFCQLPNFGRVKTEPAESGWAELRESQSKTLSLADTGEAVLIDLGEDDDIHPRHKTEVGARLARLALARDYDQKIAWSGPTFDSMERVKDAIRIHFAHAESGLSARQLAATYQPRSTKEVASPLVLPSPLSQVQGFSICGEDQKWKWADAEIAGNTVIVKSTQVPDPIAVRYAWADSPICNLYNGDGLPAAPFRTDHFTGITEKAKYGLGPL